MSDIDHEAAKELANTYKCGDNGNLSRAYLDHAARVEALSALCKEAIESVESWGEYASDYFKKKHNLAGDIEQMQAELTRLMEDSQ